MIGGSFRARGHCKDPERRIPTDGERETKRKRERERGQGRSKLVLFRAPYFLFLEIHSLRCMSLVFLQHFLRSAFIRESPLPVD